MKTIENDQIQKISEIIKEIQQTHTSKQKYSKKIITPLKPDEKNDFACQYYNIMGDTSLIELLSQIYNKDIQLRKLIISFMIQQNLLKPYPDTIAECFYGNSKKPLLEPHHQTYSVQKVIREYDYQNWLEPFNENIIFQETKTKHPAYRIYKDKNGNLIKFDKEKATQIKLAIVDHGIFPAKCIVEGAYQYVANDTFNDYIQNLTSRHQRRKI